MTWRKIAKEKLRQLKRVDLSERTTLELVLDDIEAAMREAKDAAPSTGHARSVAVRSHKPKRDVDLPFQDESD